MLSIEKETIDCAGCHEHGLGIYEIPTDRYFRGCKAWQEGRCPYQEMGKQK